jgi:membrane protein YqaA with SNARE-associated domain
VQLTKPRFVEQFIEWGYLGLFISSFLAATVIPMSSEIVLSILLANQYDFLACLSFATLGNWLGGISSYALGSLGNWSALERVFGIEKNKVVRLQNYINKWGSALAILCWLPLIGDVFAVGLGFFKVSFPTVAFWMLVGKIFRYAVWGMLTLWGISLL